MESRRLWQVVTAKLKANQIDDATEAKRKLEDKQRSDAKERLENKTIYKPKVGGSLPRAGFLDSHRGTTF